MAVRQASLRYDTIGAFLKSWRDTVSQGAAFLPAGTVEGGVAPEFKLDLIVPAIGTIGPFNAQVVHTSPDGGTGVRLIETPPAVTARVAEVVALVDQVRDWLIESGELVDPSSLPAQPAAVAAPVAAAAPGQPGPGLASAAPPPPGSQGPRPRGLLIPAVGDRQPDRRGDIAGRSLRDTMMDLALEKGTGLLIVQEPDGRRRFGFWSKGGPVGWRAEPMDKEEVLGVLLYRSGNLTKEQLAESITRMNATGTRQGEALIEMGALNYGQLVVVLQKQVEFVLQRTMALPVGTWVFYNLDQLPESYVNPPLRVPSLLYRSLRDQAKGMRLEELYKSQKPVLDQYVAMREEVGPLLSEIKFKVPELKLIEVIRGTSWRLRELFSVSPMSRQDTATTIWALNELRCLDYGDSEDLDRYMGRVFERIDRKVRSLLSANHFNVLEVHWICLDDELQDGYRKLKAEFAAENYHDLSPELLEMLKTINAAMEVSYAAIKDKTARRVYREEIVESSMILQSAELLGKKGEMAIMKKDFREANLCWSKALELIPNRSDFRDGYQRAQALRRGF